MDGVVKRRQRGTREEVTLQLSAEQRRRQAKIAAAIATIDLALPGSVEVRRTRCGKAQCRCHTDDAARHGPYIVWTRKVNARTVTKVLSQDELDDYRAWLDNSRRLRKLVDDIHKLTLQVVEERQARSSRPARTRSHPEV
ncbi:MAG: DUF6788 family protein [Acidimicrobiales bacterium]